MHSTKEGPIQMEPISAPAKDAAATVPLQRRGEGAREGQGRPLRAEAEPREGAARQGQARLAREPRDLRGRPGHIIPILEREFDDFDTEAARFLRGEQTEEQFIGFRLKQGVYGQRQPDVQMIRVKPFGGGAPAADGDLRDASSSTPRSTRATSPPARTSRSIIPLADAAELIRQISEAGLSSRGVREHDPQRHRRPLGRGLDDEPSTSPRTRPPTRATSSATPPPS